jgi:hypothetical protein
MEYRRLSAAPRPHIGQTIGFAMARATPHQIAIAESPNGQRVLKDAAWDQLEHTRV